MPIRIQRISWGNQQDVRVFKGSLKTGLLSFCMLSLQWDCFLLLLCCWELLFHCSPFWNVIIFVIDWLLLLFLYFGWFYSSFGCIPFLSFLFYWCEWISPIYFVSPSSRHICPWLLPTLLYWEGITLVVKENFPQTLYSGCLGWGIVLPFFIVFGGKERGRDEERSVSTNGISKYY